MMKEENAKFKFKIHQSLKFTKCQILVQNGNEKALVEYFKALIWSESFKLILSGLQQSWPDQTGRSFANL